MERYICIHGHFYQPPRENPSLEAVELQDSAYPFHDWNERVTMECYEPNASSRILDDAGHIVRIVNNYEKISFDFNPTLLSWLQEHVPTVYETLLAADRASVEAFSGHGSALAQPYNHVILPLASTRDRRTLILWGIRDFVLRFGREPEGMWLPELAVDLPTLELLAEAGIQFTVLSQRQASRLRRLGEQGWQEVDRGKIDPTTAYQLTLPSGRRLAVFFYDSLIAHAIAFQGLLGSGEELARRLSSAFTDGRDWPQLVHVANDGEIYGHHHRHGDMALAYALQHIEASGLAKLTNYGEFLERHPPQHEVALLEHSCWSCPHGLERWHSDCGCGTAEHPDWDRSWRGPLRQALDWLRDELAPRFEDAAASLLLDPWAARDDYIEVLHDRSAAGLDEFFRRHATHQLQPPEVTAALKLLESQRQALVMYTSSGWYFDDISGLEATQAIRYAGRALQLTEQVTGASLEPGLLERLAQAQSNIPEHQDGAFIYRQWVKPSLVDLEHVCAHFAMNSLFETYGESLRVHSYRIEREDYQLHSSGRMRLALGRARVLSEITHEQARFEFVVLHMGDHNLLGSVRPCSGDAQAPELAAELVRHFAQADLAELVRAIDHHFSQRTYSLKRLFRDEQRKILATILDATLADAEAVYRQVYEKNAQMMGFLADIEVPMPQAWQVSAELVINSRLRQAFASPELDPQAVSSLVAEANRWQVPLDGPGLAYTLRQTLEQLVERLSEDAEPALEALQRLEALVSVAQALPFEVNLRKVQNLYYGALQRVPAGLKADVAGSYDEVLARLNQLVSLGERLEIHTAEVVEVKENLINRAARIRELADQIASERRVPRATYRLQFAPEFAFRQAQEIAGYLDELGVSDLYASPLLKAGADSTHGYDICDHRQLNPRLGGAERFNELSAALQQRGMGLLLDLVPNHMGIGDVCNSWWLDVLENGPSSIYADFFDIDWHPVTSELENKVLLPILEDQFGKVLENGTFRLAYADGCFFVHHYDNKLPLAPRSYSLILSHQLAPLVNALGEDNPHVIELQSILTALSYLPQRTELAPEKIAERNREVHVIKGRIAALYQASSYVRAAIDAALEEFNGTPGDPRSFDLLETLLNDQAFRPAFWRVAADEINYRRFFDINHMAAIRPENHAVFHATHELVLQLLAEGKVTGLRIDHPDGLWDPRGYFRQLQEHYVAHTLRGRLGLEQPASPGPDDLELAVSAWFTDRFGAASAWAQPWPLYVVVEKILSPGERLHADWAVDGTTGYDFVNELNGVFVDGENVGRFDAIYAARALPEHQRFHDLTNSTKKMIMLVSLASELNTLGHRLERVAEKNRLYRDFTLNSLIFAIREIMAALPVYRTYTTDVDAGVADQDRQHVETAVAEAKRRNPRTAAAVFDFIRDTLTLANLSDFPPENHQELLEFVMKFQQVSGPAMAKGVEDTAFYVYNRLVSLNEVGGHPEHFGHGPKELHQLNLERAQRWPHALLTTSTHDTKRSADVRARINVLSEIPSEWERAVKSWEEQNAGSKTKANGNLAPDSNDEYLLYQALIGAWPEEDLTPEGFAAFRERIADYMRKATKEAKVHTSWINANGEYDDAVQKFIASILAEQGEGSFVSELRPLQRRVATFGRFNALAQTLIKLTAPGVPDIYQGDELWDLSLVDPDNRRPVDYRRRQGLLGDLRAQLDQAGQDLTPLAGELVKTMADGRIKLYLTWRTLQHRRQHPRLFAEGSYQPLEASGAKAGHVFAFRRAVEGAELIAVAPRLVVGLLQGKERPPLGAAAWADTRLTLPAEAGASGGYRDLFTGSRLAVSQRGSKPSLALSEILADFPVALLYRE